MHAKTHMNMPINKRTYRGMFTYVRRPKIDTNTNTERYTQLYTYVCVFKVNIINFVHKVLPYTLLKNKYNFQGL